MQIKTTIKFDFVFDQLARMCSNKDYNNMLGNFMCLLGRTIYLKKLNILILYGPGPGRKHRHVPGSVVHKSKERETIQMFRHNKMNFSNSGLSVIGTEQAAAT